MSSTYAISVSSQTTAQVVEGRTQGYRLLMTLTVAAGFVDAGLFLFLRTGEDDVFQAVCSPQNLNDYFLAAPGAPEPWLRLDHIDLVFSSQLEAVEIEREIREELKQLCDEMTKLVADLTQPATEVISDDVPLV